MELKTKILVFSVLENYFNVGFLLVSKIFGPSYLFFTEQQKEKKKKKKKKN